MRKTWKRRWRETVLEELLLPALFTSGAFPEVSLVSFAYWRKELGMAISPLSKQLGAIQQLPKRYREPLSTFGLEKFITIRNKLRRADRSIHQVVDQMREQIAVAVYGWNVDLTDLRSIENAIVAGDTMLPEPTRLKGYVLSRPYIAGTHRTVVSRNGNVPQPKRVQDALSYIGNTPFDIHPEIEHMLYLNKEKVMSDQTEPVFRELERIESWDRFYNTVFLDWRGRYYNGSGILSHQGDDLNRSLVCFADAYPFTDEQWDRARDFLKEEYGKYFSSFTTHNVPESWKAYSAWLACTDQTFAEHYIVQLDTKSSGPLLVSLMMRDKNLLTTILEEDFYLAIVDQFLNEGSSWSKALSEIDTKILRKEIAKPTGIQTMYGTASDALACAIGTILVFGQECDMSLLDTKSTDGLATQIEKGRIPLEEVTLSPASCLKSHLADLSVPNQIRQLSYLAKSLQQAMFNRFPSIKDYLGTLKGAASSWYKKTDSCFSFVHPLDNNIIIHPFPHKRGSESIKDYIDISFTMDDERKRIRKNLCPMTTGQGRIAACAPCFTHLIDAVIVTLVVNKCQKLGIPIATIHDSFGVPVAYVDTVRQIFKEVLIWMFTNHDYLGDFCKAHNKRLPQRAGVEEFDIAALLDKLPSAIG